MDQKKKIALVLRGHFRSFEKNQAMWKDLLKNFDYDCYFHTWDTVDSVNQSWYRRKIVNSPTLTENQIHILKDWDPNVVIEKQEFTQDEHNEIYASWTPHKALLYRFDSLLNTLKRIDKTKYDFTIISRYDIIIKNISFENLTVVPGQILLGARECAHIFGGIAVNSELFVFHTSDLDKFYNPLSDANPRKYTNAEEWFSEMYQNIFKEIKHLWKWEEHFNIDRTTK